tara:strand:+ start:3546 stop:3923 length:378 start_codon:yes stop_codon:yes gene_type:complete
MRKPKLKLTPITEETFNRQGWVKHSVEDMDMFDEPQYKKDDDDDDVSDDEPYFFTLPIPKNRIDKYAPMLVSNVSNELEELKSMRLKPGQYFIEMLDMDGIGFCSSEEELEILYKSLTGNYIEND